MTLRSRFSFLFCALFVAFGVQSARAVVFVVNDTADVVDAAPGDGSCNTSADPYADDCTLRAAIQEANALAGDDTVMLPAGTFAITIPLVYVYEPSDDVGSFYLNSNVNLVGKGTDLTILDGGMLDRVLHARSNISATVSDLTIQNGSRSGVGVDNGASLTLLRVTVQDNTRVGFEAIPAGIEIQGATLSLVESTVQRNSVVRETGGIVLTGGTFSAVDTVIRDNHGSQGIVAGGMICNGGTATFERVAFIDNSGNSGGALFVSGESCNATLTNVTLSGNSANSSSGALHNTFGTVTLVNVTVTNNSAPGLGGPMTVRNTIVAGNGLGSQCSFASPTSLGHNIDQGESCGFDQPTDLTMIDPDDLLGLLGPLDEEGGSPVHPLLAGSLAIDAIPVNDCVDSDLMPLLTDQLGVDRPQGSACDIGAVEFVPEPVAMALQLAALFCIGLVALSRRGLQVNA
jgi:CSLREA domain-containing protein